MDSLHALVEKSVLLRTRVLYFIYLCLWTFDLVVRGKERERKSSLTNVPPTMTSVKQQLIVFDFDW